MRKSTVIVGDIGGNTAALTAVLTALGCDPTTGTMPNHLHVVQVGDVVRMVDDEWWTVNNPECMTIVDRMMNTNPHQWVQLWGNHDLSLVGGRKQHNWNIPVDDVSRWIAEQWWATRKAKFATTVGGVLVTHAGLDRHTWKRVGEPAEAGAAADCINQSMYDRPRNIPFGQGRLLDGDEGSEFHPSDVTWALLSDVVHSWTVHLLGAPFDQFVGHSRMVRLRDYHQVAGEQPDQKPVVLYPQPTNRRIVTTVNQGTLHETTTIPTESDFARIVVSVDTGLVAEDAPTVPYRLLTVKD